jgi:hypothetical protein
MAQARDEPHLRLTRDIHVVQVRRHLALCARARVADGVRLRRFAVVMRLDLAGQRVADTLRAFADACGDEGGSSWWAAPTARKPGARERAQARRACSSSASSTTCATSSNSRRAGREQREESFGLAALEALACGVPVVGYDSGGMKEVVEDGRTGFLVRFGDVPALGARLRTLLANETMRREFGARGRRRAEDDFSLQKILAVHERLYHDAIGSAVETSRRLAGA